VVPAGRPDGEILVIVAAGELTVTTMLTTMLVAPLVMVTVPFNVLLTVVEARAAAWYVAENRLADVVATPEVAERVGGLVPLATTVYGAGAPREIGVIWMGGKAVL
jgi:hypothetical protein